MPYLLGWSHQFNNFVETRRGISTESRAWLKTLIALIVIVKFNILLPFSLSGNPILRLLTTDKVYYYFFCLVFSAHIIQYRSAYIENIPGLKIVFFLLLSMACSNYLAESQDGGWGVYWRELGLVLYSLAAVLVLSSFEAIKIFLRWSFYVTLALVVISLFELVSLRDVLPAGVNAILLAKNVESQTGLVSTLTQDLVDRRAVLWFDSNGFGYLIGAQIIYLIYLIISERSTRGMTWLRYGMLFVLIPTLFQTLSRGSTFCTIFGTTFVLMLSKNARSNRLKLLLTLGVVSLLIFMINGPPEAVAELFNRFYIASGLFGNASVANKMSGMETGRYELAMLAFEEFLQKPVFGWGSAAHIGYIAAWHTGNHLGYLNLLGKYGMFGFGLNLVFLWLMASRLKNATNYLKNQRNPNCNLGYLLMGILVFLLSSGLFRGISIIGIAGPILGFYLAVDRYRMTVSRQSRHV